MNKETNSNHVDAERVRVEREMHKWDQLYGDRWKINFRW